MRFGIVATLGVGTVLLPPLVFAFGENVHEITKAQILAAGSEWREKYDQYDPPGDMVDALKSKLVGEVKIDIYLGLWCPDSRHNVPPFIKIMDRAETTIPIRYFDVPKKADKEAPYFVDELKVARVPTFIFYRNGQEIGRIVENPKTGLIEDMMEIFFR